jgi:hypothetical protein
VDKTKRLLERGYFPSQLPPPFTSRHLARLHSRLAAAWPTQYSRIPATRGEHFSVARAGHTRRPVTIPNPVNQFYLTNEIATFWTALQSHFQQSKISLSTPVFSKSPRRATDVVPLSELYERRLVLSAGFRFVLQTDISRFFPTLYTHSIPWALHTKPVAKANVRSLLPAHFGNLLDLTMQRCQERQTIGIPIGPDTSHIVAEVIATSVDVLIREGLGYWPVGYRHVDDYFLCFQTHRDAEAALAMVARALSEYELDINPTKTSIMPVEQLHQDGWVDRLKSFDIRDDPTKQRQDIHRFFTMALELDIRFQHENVMKYALKRSSGFLIAEANWQIYEAYLYRIGTSHQNTLQTICSMLATYKHLGYPINRRKATMFCASIIAERAPLEHHSEVAWSLWLALELGLRLNLDTATIVSKMRSSVCALVTLHLKSEGLIPSSLDTSFWRGFLDREGLRGGMWLLAYEASFKGWLPDLVNNFCAADPFFAELKQAGVYFYELPKRIAPLIQRVPDDMDGEGAEQYEFVQSDDFYGA